MAEIIARNLRFHVQRLTPPPEVHRVSSAEPVVFIHGLCLDNLCSFLYTLAHPVADAGADVILYDQRGHGLSERPRTGYRVNDSADDLAAILDTLGVDSPVHLVGHSYGGAIALRFAVAYPERVASILLIEAHVPVPGWGEQMAAAIRQVGVELVDGDMGRWMATRRKYARLAELGKDLIYHTTLTADLQATEALSERELRTLTGPIHAVYGEHSDVLSHAYVLDGLLSRYTLTVLPDLDHWVVGKATQTMRTIALEWLATHSAVGVS